MKIVYDTWVLFSYYIRASFKNPMWLGLALFQPMCYLYLYAPLLENFYAKTNQDPAQALQIFTPGLLVLLVIFGTMFVGFAIIDDLKSGVVERFRATPVSRMALILGRTSRDVVTLAVQGTILILLAMPMGLKIEFIPALSMMGLVLLVGFCVAPLSYALALTIKSEEAIAFVLNFFLQPLILLSGILLPLTLAPNWLKILSSLNPLSYVISASHSILNGQFTEIVVIQGLIVLSAFVVLSVWLGTRAYNRALI